MIRIQREAGRSYPAVVLRLPKARMYIITLWDLALRCIWVHDAIRFAAVLEGLNFTKRVSVPRTLGLIHHFFSAHSFVSRPFS